VSPVGWALYFIRRAAASVRQSPVMQLVAVSTIGVAMLVLAGLLTVLQNMSALVDRWGEQVHLVAFLDAELPAARLDAVLGEIGAWPEVAGVTPRTRAEALAELQTALGPDSALLEGVDPSILPASIEITLVEAQRSPAVRAALADKLRSLPSLGPVEQVEYGQALLGRLEDARDLIRAGGLIVGVLVALAVVFIISNTVRLALYARRDELDIMRMVGATHRFIRAPYYLEGAFQGALGALLAIAGLRLSVDVLAPDGGAITVGMMRLPIVLPPLQWLALMVLGAAAVGVLASHLSAGRFLRGGA
jgi:cell division transport system permease protein